MAQKNEGVIHLKDEEVINLKMYAIVRKDRDDIILGLNTGHMMIFNSEREAWGWLVGRDESTQAQLTVKPLDWKWVGQGATKH